MDYELSKEFKVPSWFEKVKFEDESDGVKDGAFTSWGKRIPRSGLQSHGSAKRGDTRLDSSGSRAIWRNHTFPVSTAAVL